MNSKKLFIGGIIGGICYLALGYLTYRVLLYNFMRDQAGSATGVERTDVLYWSLIVGNMLLGFLLAYILIKANANSAGSGSMIGFTVGLLFKAGFDFILYGVTNLRSLSGFLADMAAFALMSAIVGGIVGAVLSMRKRVAVA